MIPINPKPQRTIRRRPRLGSGAAGGLVFLLRNLSAAAIPTAAMATRKTRNGISLIAIVRQSPC